MNVIRRKRAVLTSLAIALLSASQAGCSGGRQPFYAGQAVLARARSQARVTTPASDFISNQAPTSFDFVLKNGDSGTVAVWGTTGKAQSIMDEVPAVAKAVHAAFGTNGKPHAERHGNLTVFWDQAPNGVDEQALAAMLVPSTNSKTPSAPTATTRATPQQLSTQPTLNLQTGLVGDIGIGMDETTIDYNHAHISYSSCATGVCSEPTGHNPTYLTPHGAIYVLYGRQNRVAEIRVSRPYFRTKDGIAVGLHIPLGKCSSIAATPCSHRWRGYKLQIDNAGDISWNRKYGPITVNLYTRGGTVTSIDLFDRSDY